MLSGGWDCITDGNLRFVFRFVDGILLLMSVRAQAPQKGTIAFATPRPPAGNLWLMDADGENPRAVPNVKGSVSGMTWSPDGRKIAYYSGVEPNNDEIFVIDADGENLTRLTEHPKNDRWPTWHPNGQKIAFASKRDGNLEIYVMNANGEAKQNITNHPDADFRPVMVTGRSKDCLLHLPGR